MILTELIDPVRLGALAQEAHEIIVELYPICRSITGDGVRQTLGRLEKMIPLRRSEVASGTPVFDWLVPPEWNIREAWIKDSAGRAVVDLRNHSLHVVSYSTPIRAKMSLEELKPHLHSLPDHPDWIPYRTAYYREQWGFCLKHSDFERLSSGYYEVHIDSTLGPGHLTYGECVVPGVSQREVLIYTHTCHPSLANDNLTGIALAAILARELAKFKTTLTYRFVFGPGTIGSLTWLAANEGALEKIDHGLVIGLLGDPGPLTYKQSRRSDTVGDRAANLVLEQFRPNAQIVPFEPYGYDERQFCSPGFNLPVGRLTRSPNDKYPEYHTSADNPDFVGTTWLAESLSALVQIMSVLDCNRRYRNLLPKGEPRLGKRGLYRDVGGTSPKEFEHAMLWVLNFSDGAHDLLAIAERSRLPFSTLHSAATALETAGLIVQYPVEERVL